jgi:hypothetical protein
MVKVCDCALRDFVENVSERTITPDGMKQIDMSKPNMKNGQIEIIITDVK